MPYMYNDDRTIPQGRVRQYSKRGNALAARCQFKSDHNLKLYDYSLSQSTQEIGRARWYDPAVGRFSAVDPLASSFSPTSPYVYTLNNPIRFIDPTGMATEESKAATNKTEEEVDYDEQYRKSGAFRERVHGELFGTDGDDPKPQGLAGMIYSKWQSVKNKVLGTGDDKPTDADIVEGLKKTEEDLRPLIEAAYLICTACILLDDDASNYEKGASIFTAGMPLLGIGGKAAKGLANSSGWVKRSIFNSLDPAIQMKVAAAIEKGIVAPTGKQGIIKLTATEASQTGYQYKIKILGKGGDIRIYGNPMGNGHIVFDKKMRH